jgi:hypothetical protein
MLNEKNQSEKRVPVMTYRKQARPPYKPKRQARTGVKTGKTKHKDSIPMPKVEDFSSSSPVNQRDPFDILPEEKDSLDDEKNVALYDLVSKKYGPMIRREFRKGVPFLVLCDRKVILRTAKEPSDEEIRELEKKHGRACYIIGQDFIEEVDWSFLPCNDYYPTIELTLGSTNWTEDDVFKKGLKVVADFDTGNQGIAVFSRQNLSFSEQAKHKLRRKTHLNRPYHYELTSMKIGLKDVHGKTRCIVKECYGVLYWNQRDKNPFIIQNPNRKALVGRDLMMNFPFELTLSPQNKKSIVRLV